MRCLNVCFASAGTVECAVSEQFAPFGLRFYWHQPARGRATRRSNELHPARSLNWQRSRAAWVSITR